jgi:hypothetical protein
MSSTITNPVGNKCDHPACNCQAQAGSRYCSTNCEESMKHGQGSRTECGCDHAECRMAA